MLNNNINSIVAYLLSNGLNKNDFLVPGNAATGKFPELKVISGSDDLAHLGVRILIRENYFDNNLKNHLEQYVSKLFYPINGQHNVYVDVLAAN